MEDKKEFLTKVKPKIRESLLRLDEKYSVPEFVDFIVEPIKDVLGASKLNNNLPNIAPVKWQEFLKKIIQHVLTVKYDIYWKLGGENYVGFLLSKIPPHLKAHEVVDIINNGGSKIPPLWVEFLQKNVDQSFIDRAEKIRTDPLFSSYFGYKKKNIENIIHKLIKTDLELQEISFFEALEQGFYEIIKRQLYLQLHNPHQINLFVWLENDFEKYRKEQSLHQQQTLNKSLFTNSQHLGSQSQVAHQSQMSEQQASFPQQNMTTKAKMIEKEQFNFEFPSEESIEDAENRLGDVSRKFRNPFGNYEHIDNFIKTVSDELLELDLEDRVEKKTRVNPRFEYDVTVRPQNRKPLFETSISKPSLSQNQMAPRVINPFESELEEVKRDSRIEVEEQKNQINYRSINLVMHRKINGVPSVHDKIMIMLQFDSEPKIIVEEMSHLLECYMEIHGQHAGTKGKLKGLIELWLQAIEKEDLKAESRVNDFDDMFG